MRRVFMIILSLSAVFGVNPSYAQYDASDVTLFTLMKRTAIEKFVERISENSSSLDDENQKRRLRSYCVGHVWWYVDAEISKMTHRDIFQEIKSDDQITDILVLKEKFEATSDCMERFKLWLAYDDKWYKEERDRKWKELEAQRKVWASLVTDTGNDVYDTVFEGVFLAIPREYIWFGSRAKDGPGEAVNLQFYYPDITATPSENPDHVGKKRNIGGILRLGPYRSLPCPAVRDKGMCVQNMFSRAARSNIGISCSNKERVLGEHHYMEWLGKCHSKYDIIYNEDVGMKQSQRPPDAMTFFDGDINFPDYWVQCAPPPPILDEPPYTCKSSLQLRDNIVFKYTFPRELFWKHREIQEALRKKLESFIVQAP